MDPQGRYEVATPDADELLRSVRYGLENEVPAPMTVCRMNPPLDFPIPVLFAVDHIEEQEPGSAKVLGAVIDADIKRQEGQEPLYVVVRKAPAQLVIETGKGKPRLVVLSADSKLA